MFYIGSGVSTKEEDDDEDDYDDEKEEDCYVNEDDDDDADDDDEEEDDCDADGGDDDEEDCDAQESIANIQAARYVMHEPRSKYTDDEGDGKIEMKRKNCFISFKMLSQCYEK